MAEQNKLNPSLSAERPLSEITDPNNDRFRVFQVRINFTLPKSTVDPEAQAAAAIIKDWASIEEYLKESVEDSLGQFCADAELSPNDPAYKALDNLKLEVDIS